MIGDYNDKATLDIHCRVMTANKGDNPDVPQGLGTPLTEAEMDILISEYLDDIITKVKSDPKSKCFVSFDVDGTLNYRFSGYGMTANMSFFGSQAAIDKMRVLKDLGVNFIALTGAPEGAVRTIFQKWQEKRPEISVIKDVLDSFKVIKCEPTDIKGEALWDHVRKTIESSLQYEPNIDSLYLEFLDDSVRNAGNMVPDQFVAKFLSEGATALHQISHVQLNSNWLATGIGDYNVKQQLTARSGMDFAYNEENAACRARCQSHDKQTVTMSKKPTIRSVPGG